MARRRDTYAYTVYFLATAAAIFGAVLITIVLAKDNFPAPRLSSSEAFNEKARWLRELNTERRDVLVIGSSMALNNVDGPFIEKHLNGKKIANAASFGLSVAETAELLEQVGPIFKPTLIVLAVYYSDFVETGEKSVDWGLFGEYVRGASAELVYVRSMDLKYYAETFSSRRKIAAKHNRVYQSLIFDGTGSVVLDCEDFEVDDGRWNGFMRRSAITSGAVQPGLEGLASIEATAKRLGSRLIVISTPMREAAREHIAKSGGDALWSAVARSVRESGGTFVDVSALSQFDDSFFVDFAHLNKCGTRKMADLVLPNILSALEVRQ